ncbi:MAG: hypothetical protein ABI042_00360 [Verrucomicrobiota bacterium]
MKTNLRLVRLVVAATFGSLLWAGCSTMHDGNHRRSEYRNDISSQTPPYDLTRRRVDTHPEWRTGLDRATSRDTTVDVPVDEAPTIDRR